MASIAPNAPVAPRAVIADVLFDAAAKDKDVVVLCSDSRGSAALEPFFEAYPNQAVEVGIAEQDLVGIAAGLASCGKRAVAVSPASFLATRSYEQARVDCAYSDTNVTLVGISGGVSYGELGMTHQSAQDIAALAAVPNMRVYLPSDRHQTKKLMEALLQDEKCAYVRVGRGPVPDVYSEDDCPFELDKANVLREGEDVALIACGELVAPCLDAAKALSADGVSCTVVDMHCVKPLDGDAVVEAATGAKVVLTAEEHSKSGGLGARVAQVVGEECPRPVKALALPDTPVVTGTKAQILEHYGLDAAGIAASAKELLAKV